MKSLLFLSLLMVGCSEKQDKQELLSDYSYKVRRCAEDQLSAMSASDSVQKWDAELYNAVADRCEKWHGGKQ